MLSMFGTSSTLTLLELEQHGLLSISRGALPQQESLGQVLLIEGRKTSVPEKEGGGLVGVGVYNKSQLYNKAAKLAHIETQCTAHSVHSTYTL